MQLGSLSVPFLTVLIENLAFKKAVPSCTFTGTKRFEIVYSTPFRFCAHLKVGRVGGLSSDYSDVVS